MGYGKKLKQAALEKSISIRKLGMITNISPDTLYSAIRRDTGLRFDQALRVAEYLDIIPELICDQCYFEDRQEGKGRSDTFITGIHEGRKKGLIQKIIETLLEFDEDQLDIVEVLLVYLKNMSLEEGIWLMNLVSAAVHYPDTLFEEWMVKVNNREQISNSGQNQDQGIQEEIAGQGRRKTVE